jgi:hypothetical protein
LNLTPKVPLAVVEISNIVFGALLGALLSIVGGFLAEEWGKRRRLWVASRLLLHELQRFTEAIDAKDPEEVEVNETEEFEATPSLRSAIDEYKVALFAVDRWKFEKHWPVFRDLVRLLDSTRSPSEKELLLILDSRRRLAQLLGTETPGSAKVLGVSETGSPVSYGPSRNEDED